ncbi:MAG: glycosyltransferase [Gemmatimonadota bacterium]
MKKLLWVGDDPDSPSGFGVATKKILQSLDYRLGGQYDVAVLGMNAKGDPGTVPYHVYLAGVGGDGFGVKRIAQLAHKVQADVIVIQQDGWNIQAYIEQLRQFKETKDIPVVAAVAVDGKNFNGEWLRNVSHAIFWTQFALDEAREGGYHGPASVIPLGVDLDTYKPLDKTATRKMHNTALAEVLGNEKNFIIGNVNRNQPRKRWDLTIRYFAKWIEDNNINNAWLYMHAAPTGDASINVIDLARYYNCLDRTLYVETPIFTGITEEKMCKTYNCFDVCISTTQGEGMGLPALEAMACGVPCLLPDWSAFGDWAKDAAVLVPCTSTHVDFPYVNVIGGVVDEVEFIAELDKLYRDSNWRMQIGGNGLRRVNEERFRWESIGQRYAVIVEGLLADVEAKKAEKTVIEQNEERHEEMQKRLVDRRMKIMSGEVSA